MADAIRWTRAEMIEETISWWGADYDPADCEVIESELMDDLDEEMAPTLIVHHKPTGRFSTEAGNAGRWHLDGTAFDP